MIGWLGEQTGDIKLYVEREELEAIKSHGAVEGEVLRLGTDPPPKKRKTALYFDNGTIGKDGRTMKSFVGDHKSELVTVHLSERDYRKLAEEARIEFYDTDTRHSVHIIAISDATYDLGFYEALVKSLQSATV